MRARRSLGQNFLVDAGLRDAVAAAAAIQPDDEVLEVGAGPGALTEAIAGRCRRLVAVELDRRLAAGLRRRFAGVAGVEVLEADILEVDLAALFPGGGEVVVGNIPYHLTGLLARRLLEPEPRPRRLSLVVQREVAERWTAERPASLSSLAVQVFATARLAVRLPAAAFDPPPRVDSACVVLDVRDRPALDVPDLPAAFRFAERVFQFRRKQLGASLPRVTGLPAPELAAALGDLGIDPRRRAQTLGLPEWEAVVRRFAG